jgi:3D (Asp-Asp-Asp) domain-containing protein
MNEREFSRTTLEDLCAELQKNTTIDASKYKTEVKRGLRNADGSGVLTLANGDTVAFSAVKNMTATAYTAGEGGVDHHTATGTMVRTGTVAVDRRVIPLGTKMYIVTSKGSYVYGLSVAEDTGVRGNIVDLYMPTYEDCINFGRRGVTVYILE